MPTALNAREVDTCSATEALAPHIGRWAVSLAGCVKRGPNAMVSGPRRQHSASSSAVGFSQRRAREVERRQPEGRRIDCGAYI